VFVKRLLTVLLVVVVAAALVATGLYVAGYRWPPFAAIPGSPGAVADFPDPSTFQSGDFVWPKKKGAVIPFSLPDSAPSNEEAEWNAQHERFLRDAAAQGPMPPDVLEKLKALRYSDYERSYFDEPSPSLTGGPEARSLSGATVAVGHVAIIDIDAAGIPYVIEAIPIGPDAALGKGGVIRVRYDEWLKDRAGSQVWHGRVRGLDRAMRKKIVDEALKQLGKPYQFFNFNLIDDSGFYCSKLAWMSTWRGANIAPDDDPNPQRGTRFPPWFSPRQLTQAKQIEMLHKPGEY
jgi:cell wall-associated NlpC family hydrolase